MVLSVAVVIAFVVAMTVGRYANAIGSAFKLLDYPDADGGRKRHVRVTPLVGGVGVTLTMLAAGSVTLAWAPIDGEMMSRLAWLGFAVTVMFLMGAADDRFDLGPLTRLLGATAALLPVVGSVAGFQLETVHFTAEPAIVLAPWVGLVFALLCLLALLNAVNMADGKNGVVISLGLIWSVVLMVRLPVELLPLTAAVAVALAVLLFFNMANRLFLGDGGSYAVSAFFGLLAIYAYNNDPTLRADDIVLMFAIPIFDTARLIVVRSWQRQSPFHGGRDHLHHFLFARVGWPRGLYCFVALAAVPNFASLLLPGTTWSWIAVSALAYGVVVWWAQSVATPVAVASGAVDCPVVPIASARSGRVLRRIEGAASAPKRAVR